MNTERQPAVIEPDELFWSIYCGLPALPFSSLDSLMGRLRQVDWIRERQIGKWEG
jgi:hypothetical protein